MMNTIIFAGLSFIVIYFLRIEDISLNSKDIHIIQNIPEVESILTDYKDVIGSDYDGYRGHIYRVLSYSMHYLNNNEQKQYLDVIAAALVYHDIGLWTDKQLDYLEPGCKHAKERFEGVFDQDKLDLMDGIITYHHKFTPYEGTNAHIINAVRKADMIDFSLGLVNYGMPDRHIQLIHQNIANNGFHMHLGEIGFRYYGYDVMRIVSELSKIFKL